MNRKSWLGRVLLILFLLSGCVVVLGVAGCFVETQIQKRAWERCKLALEAKGADFNWNDLIPPPVPDNQNFYKARNMSEWFVGRGPTALSRKLDATNHFDFSRADGSAMVRASNYLAWTDAFDPEFDQIREALKRPYARMNGDYLAFTNSPLPNYVTFRLAAKTLAQRARCDLVLGKPEYALGELELIQDFSRLLGAEGTNRSTTLAMAMSCVELEKIFLEAVTDGIRWRAWKDPQLRSLQDRLQKTDLIAVVAAGFRNEQAWHYRLLYSFLLDPSANPLTSFQGLSQQQRERRAVGFRLLPRALVYRNFITAAAFEQDRLNCVDLKHRRIMSTQMDAVFNQFDTACVHWTWRNVLAGMVEPNFSKVWPSAAWRQTEVDEALVACALERYHLDHGRYPRMLADLAPQYLVVFPNDLIGGRPLTYHLAGADEFVLYSVGWDATDDGGQTLLDEKGEVAFTRGDWVWRGADNTLTGNPNPANTPLVATP